MTKTVVCIGGPADGREFAIHESAGILTVPYCDPVPLSMNEDNLFAEVIGWDDYGLIFDHHIKGAKYEIRGNEAVYTEKEESE
jgi:hypothetical protein